MNELEQSLIIKVSNGNIREAQEAAKAVLAAKRTSGSVRAISSG